MSGTDQEKRQHDELAALFVDQTGDGQADKRGPGSPPAPQRPPMPKKSQWSPGPDAPGRPHGFAPSGIPQPSHSPEMPTYGLHDHEDAPGAGRVTGFAVLAAGLCFLPWYSVRAIGASITASGMETEHGPMCLMVLAAVIVLTWVDKLFPAARTATLAAATLAGAVALFLLFLEWNQEAGMLRELVGLTVWFYLTVLSTGAAAWFSWQRLQEYRLRA